MTSTPRVAVVGGGILGVSTAVHLARRGAPVTLVTRGEFGDGATGRSLAWLNSFGLRSVEYHRLRMRGLARYRELAAHSAPGPVRFNGGLKWARPDDTARLREAYEHMQRIGYPCEWLTADQVAQQCPGVDPGALPPDGGVYAPAEGWVDLPVLVRELVTELAGLGATILTGTGDAEVLVRDGAVAGVSFPGREVVTDAVVVATGAGVPAALAAVGVAVPDATPTALMLTTTPVGTALRSVLNTPRVAVRPTPDGALAVDSGWSEREVGVRPDGTYDVREETVRTLLAEAAAVLAGHPRLEVAATGVGPKPIPGDGDPVLGAVSSVPGYHVAFSHSGATLGLAAGELLADAIITGEPDELLRPFGPDRFATAKVDR